MNSPHEITAECQHYDLCGGCSLQHLNAEGYHEHKNSILRKTIQQLGVDESIIQPLIRVEKHSRRRAEFKVRRNKKIIEIGFFEAKTHRLFDLKECPVSEAALLEKLPAFRETFAILKKSSAINSLNITVLEQGLDVIIGTSAPLPQADREALTSFATSQQLVRLTEQGEGHSSTLYDSTHATVQFAETEVSLPVGAFLQASHKGEAAITRLVTQHLKGCARVVDLYSGCGTYSFPLLTQSERVTAFEGAGEMVAAMHNSITKNQLEQSISANVRDLYFEPVTATELKYYEGAVINPPRNGALPQVKEIAKSNISKLVMVSCHPATFKRDAEYLLKNGFILTEATPIDQFYWTTHLEVVGMFERVAA